MCYRVVIPTAGIGSRLKDFTKYINKSLVSIANRPTISHLIEQFPPDCEFVIALGHKGKLVKDFLELAYPDRSFFFANVDPYKGKGSGLGFSLLACEQYLQQPFVFLSCDTLVKESIPKPDCDWMGYSERDDSIQYRVLKIDSGKVSEICEKGAVKNSPNAYIGLAGIYNYQNFWKAMHSGGALAIEQGESYGMRTILEDNKVYPYKFTWFDTGNLESIKIAREAYSEPDEPNILEKENEAIWFVDDIVIKYSNDKNFIANRIKRVSELEGFVPKVYAHRENMYCYKKVNGEVLSSVISLPIFDKFLQHSRSFWSETFLTPEKEKVFHGDCLKFYKIKTFERIDLFYKIFNKSDSCEFINNEEMPLLKKLLDSIDWNWLCQGLPGRYHGDFHFENILWINDTQSFSFLDWRQDFAGSLSIGDIYYDLAKLKHGLIINHGLISKNHYSVSWGDDEIKYDFHRTQALVECEKKFNDWLVFSGYDLKKVEILTALIFLNIAALHHNPYSLLLFALGKKMLKNKI